MSEQKTQIFHVEGMTCASCAFFIEETLPGNVGVTQVKVDVQECTATVSGELVDDPAVLAEKLTECITDKGYRLSLARTDRKKNAREFLVAVPAALLFILLFFFLQELGFMNAVTTSNVTFGTAFLIGLIASVSTCLAVVGGLVLSISANAAKKNGHWQSQMLFHGGRLGGFFILGGVIGVLGKVFQLGYVGNAILGIAVACVMLVLGLNLLDTFPIFQKLQVKIPKGFSRSLLTSGSSSHQLAPLLAGIATFFLPCGFTQSMQVYTLTTGSYVTGGLTMFFFALGTLPVLALLSFGALEISHKPWKGTFFKTVGIVVIALAVFNLINTFSLLSLSL